MNFHMGMPALRPEAMVIGRTLRLVQIGRMFVLTARNYVISPVRECLSTVTAGKVAAELRIVGRKNIHFFDVTLCQFKSRKAAITAWKIGETQMVLADVTMKTDNCVAVALVCDGGAL